MLTLKDFQKAALVASGDKDYDQSRWTHCVLAYARRAAGLESDNCGPHCNEIENSPTGKTIRRLLACGSSGVSLLFAGIQEDGLVNLQGADLRGADLRGADLRGADLRGADLRGTDLWDADLWEVDLRGANLRGADLRGMDLRGADLLGADLSGADLRDADLQGVKRFESDPRIEGWELVEGKLIKI